MIARPAVRASPPHPSERRGRALVAAAVVCALALGLLAGYLSFSGRIERAPARLGPQESGAVEPPVSAALVAAISEAPPRATVERPADEASRGGPFLVGRVLDEQRRALVDGSPRVDVAGFAGQRLRAPLDAAGGFGPLRLVPGRWVVTASAPGRRSAECALEIVEGLTPEALELVLPRAAALEVNVVAVGPGRGGDPERDLDELAGLLSLHLSVAGEPQIERRALQPSAGPDGGRRAVFEPTSGRAATLELRLGGERVLQRDLAAHQAEVTLAVDALDLWGRLVELEIVLRDASGAPLAGVLQALLLWEGGAHLVAGQPGLDPTRARFAVCPPGPATLRVVDVDGRRATAELSVPCEGPALLEPALELLEPPR